jgi:RimJ/RimL family protein N-acetyltransferase
VLEESFAKLRSSGVTKVRWAFDSADFWGDVLRPYPHWHKQRELADRVGMSLRQEKINYLYPAAVATHSAVPSRLIYRTLQEVGEAAYIEAIWRVTEGTLDQSDLEVRHRLGPEQAASQFYHNINDGMRYEPRLWKLGYTSSGALAGLIAPLKMWGDLGTLGYIGVTPEHRGHGYGVDLLQQGTTDLQAEGIRRIIADTDALNVPMQRTFETVGYQLQGRSWSYEVQIREEQQSS